jgi:short-subunit dehydrogenase
VGRDQIKNLPANDALLKKRILIIGGSSGLGRELAALYAKQGHEVAVLARRSQLLTELKTEFPSILIQQGDIAAPNIREVVGQLIGELKGLDIIIIAASIVRLNPALSADMEDETVSVNTEGFTKIITLAWHYMKSAGGGQIVGITSIAAARGNKMAPAYHASKSFQSIYLESLRVKANNERNNITITELIPGYMKTEMGMGDRVFWAAHVTKAARQSARAIRKKRKRAFITKRWWWVFHIQRLLPIFIYDWLVNLKWKT